MPADPDAISGPDRGLLHLFCLSIIGLLLKQLRVFDASVGPFELMALACALVVLWQNTSGPMAGDVHFMRFTYIRVAAFLAGAAVSLMFFREHFFLREVLATLFIALQLVGWINLKSVDFSSKLALLRDYIGGYSLLVAALALLNLPFSHKLWYFDEYMGRLMGLSDNPNQLAALTIAGLLMSAVLVQVRQAISRRDLLFCAAMLVAGVLSKSMAFRLSVLIFLAVVGLLATILHVRSEPSARRTVRVVALVLGIVLIIASSLYGTQLLEDLRELYQGGSGKGSVRVSYWQSAMVEWLQSPLVGLGPGGHIRVDHTPELQEAHNIIIELLLSGGIVALLAFVVLLWRICALVWQKQLYLVLAVLAALVAFGAFHTVLRHLTYWIVLHACVVMAYNTATVAPGVMRGQA